MGGGNEGVRAIVHDAEQAGYPNVFAVVDRDLGQSNMAHWLNPTRTSRVFVLPVHEVENYLLDPISLETSPYNEGGRTPDEIGNMLKEHAQRLCWWMAGCRVVAELRRRFRLDFVTDPGPSGTDDEATVARHILGHPWFEKLVQSQVGACAIQVRQAIMARYETTPLCSYRD